MYRRCIDDDDDEKKWIHTINTFRYIECIVYLTSNYRTIQMAYKLPHNSSSSNRTVLYMNTTSIRHRCLFAI